MFFTFLRRLGGAILVLSAIWFAGCSGDPQRAAVMGRITLDGKPVESGHLSFIPTGGNSGPVAGGVIINGRFSIEPAGGVWIGTNRVEIHATVKTGKQIVSRYSGGLEDEVTEGVPDRYNRNSELVIEIKPGKNQADFALTANP